MTFSVNAPVPIKFYQARQGDTLATISNQHNVTEEVIHAENPELNGGEPEIGQMLVLRNA